MTVPLPGGTTLVKLRRSLTPFFKRTEITLEMKRNRSIRSYSSYLNVWENFFPTLHFKRNVFKRNCTLHSSVQLRLSFTSVRGTKCSTQGSVEHASSTHGSVEHKMFHVSMRGIHISGPRLFAWNILCSTLPCVELGCSTLLCVEHQCSTLPCVEHFVPRNLAYECSTLRFAVCILSTSSQRLQLLCLFISICKLGISLFGNPTLLPLTLLPASRWCCGDGCPSGCPNPNDPDEPQRKEGLLSFTWKLN